MKRRQQMHIKPHFYPSIMQKGVCATVYLTKRLTMQIDCHRRLAISSIILTQAIKARHIARTVEASIPHLLRQNPRRHTSLPIPLRRALRLPRPVEPSPRSLVGTHLGLGIRHEPRFVSVAVGGRVSVSVAAGAG